MSDLIIQKQIAPINFQLLPLQEQLTYVTLWHFRISDIAVLRQVPTRIALYFYPSEAAFEIMNDDEAYFDPNAINLPSHKAFSRIVAAKGISLIRLWSCWLLLNPWPYFPGRDINDDNVTRVYVSHSCIRLIGCWIMALFADKGRTCTRTCQSTENIAISPPRIRRTEPIPFCLGS